MSQQEEQVKFITPSTRVQGVDVPPATIAIRETEGQKIVALWFGGKAGDSYTDEGEEFVAINDEPTSVDQLADAVQEILFTSLLGFELWLARPETLREAGFAFYDLKPAQDSNALVA